MEMGSKVWRWVLGLTYIVAVAVIWIAASFVVQSVVDAGVSLFLITYICNSLFVVYIPFVEIGRYVEDGYGSLLFWRKVKAGGGGREGNSSRGGSVGFDDDGLDLLCKFVDEGEISRHGLGEGVECESSPDKQVDKKGSWTRVRVAKASL